MTTKKTSIELNSQFKEALDLMENDHSHLFVTGKAGTGKSTLLTYFQNITNKNIAVLAPTGVAAVNIGGQTIHSFFGFKPNITVDLVKHRYKNKRKKGLYKKLDAIVIDEISMVRADLLDCVDTFLRLNGPDKNLPFGGIKIIMIGDLYQLPPVVTGGERELFRTFYESPYFFSAKVFENLPLQLVELTKIYRQSDKKFIEVLNAVRNRSITKKHLSHLNQQFDPDFKVPDDQFYIQLTTTNAAADRKNAGKLNRLNGNIHHYKGIISGEFDEKAAPTKIELDLKIGAQIMLVSNDKEKRWVNGTVGKIIKIDSDPELDDDAILIKLTSGEVVSVLPHTWEMFRFVYNKDRERVESETIGSFTQYPLILAWAVTIHKSQGKTFEKVVVDMGRGAFAHGQTYVALSRCTTLDGLVLIKPITEKHILMDWRVVKFLTNYQYKQANKKMGVDEKIQLIKEAIENKNKIQMVYLKANDTKSKRTIRPEVVDQMEYMGKEFIGMEGYCFIRNDYRVFRIDRILEINEIN